MAVNPVRDAIDLDTLAFEVAKNHCGQKLPVQELLPALGLTEDEFLRYADNAMFKQKVQAYTKDMEENGIGFQMKARIQAEEMLKLNWRVAHDPDTPASVVAKLIENTVRWANLEPKQSQAGQFGSAPAFQITFNIPALPVQSAQPQQVPVEAGSAKEAITVTPDSKEISSAE